MFSGLYANIHYFILGVRAKANSYHARHSHSLDSEVQIKLIMKVAAIFADFDWSFIF